MAFALCVFGLVNPVVVRADNGADVQNYADQAVPAPSAPTFYESPLSAGTLTLQDVLEAHKAPGQNLPAPKQPIPSTSATAPLLTPSLESSSTSLMMLQGMKAALQKTGDTAVNVPSPHPNPAIAAAQGQPASLVAGSSAPGTANVSVPAPAQTVGIKYEPGQAPKNLAGVMPAAAPAAVSTTGVATAAPAAPTASSDIGASANAVAPESSTCDPKTQKWEKTCGDVGYPGTFVGKIVGETRSNCTDGALHDFWVTNTCAPPDATAVKAAKAPAATEMAEAPAASAPASEQSEPSASTEPSVSTETSASTEESAEAKPAAPSVSASSETKDDNKFCGSASETLAYEAPSKDLCRVGSASVVNGDGPWTWSCTDNDGRDSSCRTLSLNGDVAPAAAVKASAEAPAPILASLQTQTATPAAAVVPPSSTQPSKELACGLAASQPSSQAPDQNLCQNGDASAVRGSGPWRWTCSSKGRRSKVACHTVKSLDAACGPSNGAVFESVPFVGLCASGIPTGVSGDGPWTWSCNGSGGGVSVACAATPKTASEPATATPRGSSGIDGACGSADGSPTVIKPTQDLCHAGIVGAVSGNGPWSWTCSGTGGGHSASCVAPLDSRVEAPVIKKKGAAAISKSFAAAPTPSVVPPPATVSGDVPPPVVPALSDSSQPVTPPAVKDSIASAPVLQEGSVAPVPSTGSHLSLDPTISTILFTRGSGAIDTQVITTLDKLSAVLLADPDVRITLTAYADNEGSTPRDARRLSLTRALAVRDYLGGKGIADSRIDVRAEGANTTGYIDRVDVKVND